jgi:hypothetical protein
MLIGVLSIVFRSAVTCLEDRSARPNALAVIAKIPIRTGTATYLAAYFFGLIQLLSATPPPSTPPIRGRSHVHGGGLRLAD